MQKKFKNVLTLRSFYSYNEYDGILYLNVEKTDIAVSSKIIKKDGKNGHFQFQV